jgi:hypothetical protein
VSDELAAGLDAETPEVIELRAANLQLQRQLAHGWETEGNSVEVRPTPPR